MKKKSKLFVNCLLCHEKILHWRSSVHHWSWWKCSSLSVQWKIMYCFNKSTKKCLKYSEWNDSWFCFMSYLEDLVKKKMFFLNVCGISTNTALALMVSGNKTEPVISTSVAEKHSNTHNMMIGWLKSPLREADYSVVFVFFKTYSMPLINLQSKLLFAVTFSKDDFMKLLFHKKCTDSCGLCALHPHFTAGKEVFWTWSAKYHQFWALHLSVFRSKYFRASHFGNHLSLIFIVSVSTWRCCWS